MSSEDVAWDGGPPGLEVVGEEDKDWQIARAHSTRDHYSDKYHYDKIDYRQTSSSDKHLDYRGHSRRESGQSYRYNHNRSYNRKYRRSRSTSPLRSSRRSRSTSRSRGKHTRSSDSSSERKHISSSKNRRPRSSSSSSRSSSSSSSTPSSSRCSTDRDKRHNNKNDKDIGTNKKTRSKSPSPSISSTSQDPQIAQSKNILPSSTDRNETKEKIHHRKDDCQSISKTEVKLPLVDSRQKESFERTVHSSRGKTTAKNTKSFPFKNERNYYQQSIVVPPSPPTAPPFKNDGSFLEMFKKMQEMQKCQESTPSGSMSQPVQEEIKKPNVPLVGKRRGGRVLKTGMVKKAKAIEEQTVDNNPTDAWSLYLQEVKKYRETSCEEEGKTRPNSKMPMPPKELNTEADLWTAPFDPRFPNQNQTRYCYQSFLDFHRCQKVKGKDYEPCQYFYRVYNSMCPDDWTERWTEQIAKGTFPGRI